MTLFQLLLCAWVHAFVLNYLSTQTGTQTMVGFN